MNQVDELLVKMGFSAEAVARGTQAMVAQQKTVAHQVKEIWSEVGTHIKGVFAFGAFMASVERAMARVKEITALSSKTGLDTTTLQQLSQIAREELPGGAESLDTAVTKLNVTIGEGSDKLAKWGIASKSASQAIFEIADKMHEMKDPAEKAAMAVDLMGKSGANMVPLLERGADALKEMGKEKSVFSPEDMEAIKQLDELIDRVENTSTIVAGRAISFVAQVTQDAYAAFHGDFGQESFSQAELSKNIAAWKQAQANFIGSPTFEMHETSREGAPDALLDELDRRNQAKLARMQSATQRISLANADILSYKKQIAQLDSNSADYEHNKNLLLKEILLTEDKLTAAKKDQKTLDDSATTTIHHIIDVKQAIDERTGNYPTIADLASGKYKNSPFSGLARNLQDALSQEGYDRANAQDGDVFNPHTLANTHISRADILRADQDRVKQAQAALEGVPGLLSPQQTMAQLNTTIINLQKKLDAIHAKGGKENPIYLAEDQ